MDLQTEKIELMKMLLDTESQEIIDQLKSVFKKHDRDFYDELPEHVKGDIDVALKEIENGEVYDHDDVMREFKVKYGVKD
jgi:methenyltetrahydromethanopterin cyclohydrolase